MRDPPSLPGAVHSRVTDLPVTDVTRGLLGFPGVYRPAIIAHANIIKKAIQLLELRGQ